MDFIGFKSVVTESFKSVPSIVISFKECEDYSIATIERKECAFLVTQPALDVANDLYHCHGFRYYVDCELGHLRLKISCEL